jgi:hypothetical protein
MTTQAYLYRPSDLMHVPTRSSDGEAHVGTLVDLRQLRIQQALEETLQAIERAKSARAAGDGSAWGSWMERAAQSRQLFGGLLRSGGRVDWRGRPVNN